ncbi:hypothetical protein SAMN04489835_1570 [Mycolicibacterium rutilum]|uniref:MFS transporter n=1 Tax=Mycolicibacterium rutilum TaxID=370526 RepID=A0A1H6JE08_MYCRU|nr:hypothetical protein [Mycolicibacterium rutilum]SEH57082.1 hypothetical protein SAMN04489835_1570 [Mycolicibacterium rutilum]
MSASRFAARLRGAASGLLTATLAIAAHGIGGAGVPTGAALAQLAVLAATLGALTTTLRRAAETPVLVALLATGQVLGHVLLGASGHAHAATPPAGLMLAAHAVAVVAGALLIAAGERLCRAVSRTVRAAARIVWVPVETTVRMAATRAEQPLRSALLLAASVSHRGPPVRLAR